MSSPHGSSEPLLAAPSADSDDDGQITQTEGSDAQSLWDEDWMSDTGSIQVEMHPLLKEQSPPPTYQESAPEPPGNSNLKWSALLSGAQKAFVPSAEPPRQTIEIDPESRHYCRSFEHRPVYGSRGRRPLFGKLFIKVVLAVTLFFACFAIFRSVFSGWFGLCLAEDLVTRDYQIETLKSFEFSKSNNQNSGLPNGFRGTMRILSGPADQTVDLNVSIKSTESDILGGRSGADWRPSSLSRCAEASLYFRRGLELYNFEIAAQKLTLVVASDLVDIRTTIINLRQGRLVSDAFGSSRETYIDTRSSSISGTFNLHDLLSIKSRSGSVSVDINPRPAREGQTAMPAVLEVESRSGSVQVRYPANESNIPDRDYRTNIDSRSGSVRAKILHGSETKIKIRSGRLDAQILPFGIKGVSSSLITELRSGHTSVDVLKPRGHGDPLSRMASSHSVRSGGMDLRYPDEWNGTIYGDARSGSVSVRGRGVEIIKQKDKGAHKYIRAKKGNGQSKLEFDVRSGSGSATFG